MNGLGWAARVGAGKRALLAPIGCLIISIVVWLYIETPISQIGWLDPYFYLGLVNNYEDVVARYGSTYYSARLSYIAPATLLNHLLGPDTGYLAFRVIVFAGTGAVIFGFARALYSLRAALIATAWFFFHPAILRGLTWDYVDGYAACCLMVAVLLSFMPTRRPLLVSAAAGFAFGCGVDSYPMTLAVGALAAPAWLWVHWWEGRQGLWRRGVAITVGFIASFVGFVLALMALSPDADAFGPVLAMVRSVFSGGAAQWYTDVLAALRENAWYILLFPLVAVAGALSLRGGIAKPPYLAASALYLFLVLAFYLALDRVFRIGAFNNHSSTIYLFPPMMMVVISLIGEFCARSARVGIILAGAAAFCGVFFFGHTLFAPLAKHFDLNWLGLAAALSLLLLAFGGVTAQGAGLAIILAISPVVYLASYPSVFGSMRLKEWTLREQDVRNGSIHLQNTVSRVVAPEEGAVGFWYKQEPRLAMLDSLQSSHLWAYSRVVNFFHGEPGMPSITSATKTALLNKPFIALLGESEAEVAGGLAALQQVGVPYQILDRERFTGKQWSYWLAIVKMQTVSDANLRLAANISLNEFKPDHGQVVTVPGGIKVQTAKLPYSYGAKLDLTSFAAGGLRPGVIRVQMSMAGGEAGLAVTKASDFSNILAEKMLRRGARTVDVSVSDLSQVGALVVRSTDDALGDWVTIYSVSVLEPAQPAKP